MGIVHLGARNFNLELVSEGRDWWYRKDAPKNKELAAAGAAARKAVVPDRQVKTVDLTIRRDAQPLQLARSGKPRFGGFRIWR